MSTIQHHVDNNIVVDDDSELAQLVNQVDGFSDDLADLAVGLRKQLDRAEIPDRLGIGAGHGRLDPGELELVVLAMEELADQMRWAGFMAARPDDDDGEPAS